ncbi:MAG: cold shock domain-containing protein [Bacteroidales bacterium]|jgi:cold shock CspA family protein|nr:cold shock domain-containing protein [Bacteroidales bacterium]NLB02383.1 cold shock domain-containing protein [Bacteroidales bacterium]
MAISFNKKEQEKKKQRKKVEKQKRKEERKSNAGNKSFDDMIAYVDEYGRIVDTPPEPRAKSKIDADSIAVSTPKKPEEDSVLTGRVEHFNDEKGYGFIKDSNSVEKYFFHISNAYESIKQGEQVNFELERGPKGMNAVKIQLAEEKK